jgi:hypothetical protein
MQLLTSSLSLTPSSVDGPEGPWCHGEGGHGGSPGHEVRPTMRHEASDLGEGEALGPLRSGS